MSLTPRKHQLPMRFGDMTVKAVIDSTSDLPPQVVKKPYILEKAIYEISYEINNRPDWVKVPLQGILQLMEASG